MFVGSCPDIAHRPPKEEKTKQNLNLPSGALFPTQNCDLQLIWPHARKGLPIGNGRRGIGNGISTLLMDYRPCPVEDEDESVATHYVATHEPVLGVPVRGADDTGDVELEVLPCPI